MEAKLCIYVCNSMIPEVSKILKSGNFPDVSLHSFPAVCNGNAMNNNRIIEMVNSNTNQFSKIIIFLSACQGEKIDIQLIDKKIEIVHLEQCFELFINTQTIYHYIQQGNYLVTNGWLRNYKQHIHEWGFDNQSAKKFFGESVKKILLLETGLPEDFNSNIEALSKYMGKPFEILPVGNSHLQKYLESIIFDWRHENEREALNQRLANTNRESADNSLMFYHLQKLIEHTNEDLIIQDILKLSDLLFAPEQIVYQQITSTETKQHYFKPNQPFINYNTKNSLEVEINFANEHFGVLGLNGIKFPEYIPKYRNMTEIICQMAALAISNARKYSELEKTKLAITESEARFKTIFTGAPLGIALIDSFSGQIYEVNPTFAQIAGRTVDEMTRIDWMQITHPDDVQEDLDNMALLNSGKINGFQMEKRYLRPNGTYVWIQMTIAPLKIETYSKRTHLCMIEDISERKSVETTLRKLSQAVEQSPVSIVITDLDGNIEYGNQVITKNTGYSLNELLGKNPRIFNSGEHSKETYKNLWETIKTGNSWKGDFHNKKKNGELYWESAMISPIKNTKGEITHFLAIKEDITKRKEAIEQLHNSEARFKALMKQSPSVIEIYDLEGVQRSVNHAYEELWGFPASHTVNQFNILKSKEVIKTGLINYVMKAYNGESVQVPEYLFNSTGKTEGKGKGRERWLSTRIYPLKDNYNRVQNIIVTHEDITIKKEAELKIADSNQKFKNLSQSATEMLNLKSVDEIYAYISNALHQQYPDCVILFNEVKIEKQLIKLLNIKGISTQLKDKIYGLTGFNLENHNFKLEKNHLDLFKSGTFHNFKKGLPEFSGSEFPKLVAKTIEKLLGIQGIYTIGINKGNKILAAIHFFNRSIKPITDNEYIELFVKQAGIIIERKQGEEELQQSEEKYRLLTENASDVIWIFNLSKKQFTYISPAIKQLRGLSPEEALAEKFHEALTPDSAKYLIETFNKNFSAYVSDVEQANFYINQIQQPCKDGSIIWVEVSTKFRFNAQGEIEVVGVSRNIENRKKMEAELHETIATKDKFFSIISHDLRSPFASIVGLLSIMADASNNFSHNEMINFAQSAYQTSQSTYHLLENLLEWSRMQRGIIPFNAQAIHLNEFMKTCDPSTVELAMAKEIKIEFKFPNEMIVHADNNMLHSIMRNLVTNAIKFTNHGGLIQIDARDYHENTILISIKDNGIGMDKDRLLKLFNIEFNVSRPGTNNEPSSGLGLILCKEFVENHGGKIWCESKLEKGSTFYFTLPRYTRTNDVNIE